MRTRIELSNDGRRRAGGQSGRRPRALEAHLDCDVFLRGNVVTLDGEESETHAGERSCASWPS